MTIRFFPGSRGSERDHAIAAVSAAAAHEAEILSAAADKQSKNASTLGLRTQELERFEVECRSQKIGMEPVAAMAKKFGISENLPPHLAMALGASYCYGALWAVKIASVLRYAS